LQIQKSKKRLTLSTCKSRNEKSVWLWALANSEMKKAFDFEHLQIQKSKKRLTLSNCKSRNEKSVWLWAIVNSEIKKAFDFKQNTFFFTSVEWKQSLEGVYYQKTRGRACWKLN